MIKEIDHVIKGIGHVIEEIGHVIKEIGHVIKEIDLLGLLLTTTIKTAGNLRVLIYFWKAEDYSADS